MARPPASHMRKPSPAAPLHSASLLSTAADSFAMETGASTEAQADRAALDAYTQLLSKLKTAPVTPFIATRTSVSHPRLR